jgi:AraC family transcriptional regulator
MFFGDLHLRRALDGITLSHRTASVQPEGVEMHTHLEAHFVLVTGGRYVSTASGEAHPRSMLIYNPRGTTHRDHFLRGRGAFFTVSISDGRFADLLDVATPHVAVHLSSDRSCGLAVGLLMECARWDANSSLKAESLCAELLSTTARTQAAAGRLPPKWLRTACELIQDRPGDTFGVGRVAKEVGVHPAHLARTFRAFLGCTPGDLLRARRLELAATALVMSRRPLANIALDTGFSDQAQFTKAFRRTYGIPPGAYRHRK